MSFSHQSVLLSESIEGLAIVPDGIYLDGTYGRGGHTSAILSRLTSSGRLLCFDKDPAAIQAGRLRFATDPRVSFYHTCFSRMEAILEECGLNGKINGVLLDLGVSSPQIDEAERGFSYSREGPLDMRMDPTQGLTAAQWLERAQEKEISYVLKKYGEEKSASRIARNLCKARQQQPINTTLDLARVVEASIPAKLWVRQPSAKTFQALRIFINQELAVLPTALQAAHRALALGGRLAVLSFHSLEDRIVKRYFQAHVRAKVPKGIGILEKELVTSLEWVIKRCRASAQEVSDNPRARSAVLRVVAKCGPFEQGKKG